MPLSLLNHSALALFAQRTRIPTSARSIGFCAIWVCISSIYFIIYLFGSKLLLIFTNPIHDTRLTVENLNFEKYPHSSRFRGQDFIVLLDSGL